MNNDARTYVMTVKHYMTVHWTI